MFRYIQALILIFLLAGCFVKQPIDEQIGKKSFENEDYLILTALEQQSRGNYKNSIEIYKLLYKKSEKINYLIEATTLSFLSEGIEETEKLLYKAISEAPDSSKLKRIEIGFLIKQEKNIEAKEKILDLVNKDKSVINLKIAGSIYLQSKSYELALKYYESAYAIDNDENSLLNIVDIQYNYLDNKDDAIALLETHIRMHNCEIDSCFKLIEIYGKETNINGVISTYKKLYYRYRNDEYAKKVVELLVYIKDKKGAIKFLDKSGYDQELLLDIYISSQDFQSAYMVAKRLYEKTSKIDYLGRMAIYEYESNKDSLNDEILESVLKKFEKVASKIHDPLYFNYYGYILIDHDINAKKGVGLIKEALLKEPNSPYYLDSLAWGYYKLGRCKEAKVIMDKLIKVNKEEELMNHLIEINKCVKRGKK
ncbi:MAG: hypothetical protein JJV95_03055 [Sulfurospirillum sp.]|nr:hypothetical protein [Sulfurospirillum sp.]MBL0702948.1 hypothetical protein [Sulfurospirillum sp.]